MKDVDEIYSFVFRGILAGEILDASGYLPPAVTGQFVDEDAAERVSIDLLDKELVAKASRMAAVYTAITAFENSARRLISSVLLEQVGADWWEECVPNKVREKAQGRRTEEAKVRWHTPRGDEPLNYTEFGDLISIMNQNWDKFEPFIRSLDWARQIMAILERSRNVIMHSGELETEDLERIGVNIRDWIKQVGA